MSNTSPSPDQVDSDSENDPPEIDSPAWLDRLLREKCNVLALRDFQLRHAVDIVDGKDVFLVIAPGLGKSLVLLSGLIAAQARGEKGIAFLIVPTKALAQQHVSEHLLYEDL